MTYCLGIKVKEGLVALSDTRISAGTNITVKKKVFIQQKDKHVLFILTSGLRSVRDKAIYYFQDLIDQGEEYNKMYKAVNAFGEQIKRVAQEDRLSLESAGFKFNLNTIIGGQLKDDEDHKLFLLYPEGNWVEIDESTPYTIIGNSGQGKAILNRVLENDTTLRQALKAGYVSFDSTRTSGNDVEFPIDIVIYKKNSFEIIEHRFEQRDVSLISELWDQKLKNALDELPEEWLEAAFKK